MSYEICDQANCNAEALVLADFADGNLSFCGHHWDRVEDAALPNVVRVTDRRRVALLPPVWLPDTSDLVIDLVELER
jgi:hypothetical protein